MITLDSVTRWYGELTAVDDVSFTAHPGRVTGEVKEVLSVNEPS